MNDIQKQISLNFPKLTWGPVVNQKYPADSYFARIDGKSPSRKDSAWILVTPVGDIYNNKFDDENKVTLQQALREYKKYFKLAAFR